MPPPADGAADATCWSADVGPCHHAGGPAIFWPCRPERSPDAERFVDARRSPRHLAGSAPLGGPPSLRVPAAVLDEDMKWQIANMAKKIDMLSLQVDTCLNGMSDLQASVRTLPEQLASHPCGSPSEYSQRTRSNTARSNGVDDMARPGMNGFNGFGRFEQKAHLDVAEASTAATKADMNTPFVVGKQQIREDEETMAQKGLHPSDACASQPPEQQADWDRKAAVRRWSSSNFSLHMLKPRRSHCAEAVWRFLEEPDSSRASKCYHTLWVPFIFATVICTLLQSVKPPPLNGLPAGILELTFDVIFATEALVRLSVSPTLLIFFQSAYNDLDLLAALPLVGRLAVGLDSMPAPGTEAMGTAEEIALAIVCLTPVLRLLKTLRRFQQFHLFLAVISFTLEALEFLLLTLVLIVLLFSALIYLVEPRSNIETLPQAMWLTVVTMTTVGYGDITPDTNTGHGICAVLLLLSVLFMAMPIGIMGNAFTEMWKDRDRILLNHRFQDRMMQCGYTASDVAGMFAQFDVNNDGELSLSEFVAMVREMQLGIQEERAIQLFELIDKDGSGGIDAREFVREFFPTRFHEIYGSQSKKEEPVKEEKKTENERNSARSRRRRSSGGRRSSVEMQQGLAPGPAEWQPPAEDLLEEPCPPSSAWRAQVARGDAVGRGEAGTGGVPPDSLAMTCGG